MPWLYHKYVGHDTNRDWFMFTQKETRISVEKVYNVWHPQITHDMHQAGRLSPRLFVPPYRDPLDPNTDPILVAQTARIGTDILTRLTAEGKSGVVVKAIYDLWTPARAYMVYHGSIRLLSEIASCRIATPDSIAESEFRDDHRRDYYPLTPSWNHPLPFRGGTWNLAQMIDYGYSTALAALLNAARNRDQWLWNFYRVGRNAVAPKEGPHAYIFPVRQRDPAALYELLSILDLADVEISRAAKPFDADGVAFAAGDYVVKLAQPYGAFAKTMLEVQHYPDLRRGAPGPPIPPYDVTGHTLGFQLGVSTVEVEKAFSADLEPVVDLQPPDGRLVGVSEPDFYLLGTESNAAYKLINALLAEGQALVRTNSELTFDGRIFPPGTVVVPVSGKPDRDRLGKLAKKFSQTLVGFAGQAPPGGRALPPRSVKLGLYKPWAANMDEGWTRFILEQYGFSFTSLDNERIRAGNLRPDYEAVILPDVGSKAILDGHSVKDVPAPYSGGLRGRGVESLKHFLSDGGTIIAVNGSSEFLIEQFKLPVRNVLADLKQEQFYCPGSILLARFDPNHPLAWGMPDYSAVFFRHSPAFILKPEPEAAVRTVGEYPDMDLLMSGWILGEEFLRRRANLVETPFGAGRIILIGFNAQHRAQFRATYKLLFNAIYYGSMEAG
jgi:hypothetical protein